MLRITFADVHRLLRVWASCFSRALLFYPLKRPLSFHRLDEKNVLTTLQILSKYVPISLKLQRCTFPQNVSMK